jgi:hypothetical protein
MPPKRPAPLSDDVFHGALAGRPPLIVQNVVPQQTPGYSRLLGITNNGVPLPVKNTFIDVPSGLTPANMRQAASETSHPLSTAPPNLNTGFLQRAIISAGVTPANAVTPSSPQSTVGLRKILQTPLATASPSAAIGFSQWVRPGPTNVGFAAFPGTNGSTLASFPQGSLTYAMSPTSGRAQGLTLQAFSAPKETTIAPTYAQTSLPPPPMHSPHFQPQREILVQPQPPSVQPLSAELPDVDDDEDDDSDADIVPPHLRNREDAPQPPPGALHPSLGSEVHSSGTCKRCCFFPRGRCTNGYNCEFCHYEHEKRKRKSKKKKKKEGSSVSFMPAGMDGRTIISASGQVLPVRYASMQPPQAIVSYPGMPLPRPVEPPQVIYPVGPPLQQQPPPLFSYPPSPTRRPPMQGPPPYGLPLQAPPHPSQPSSHIVYGPTIAGPSQAPTGTIPPPGYLIPPQAPPGAPISQPPVLRHALPLQPPPQQVYAPSVFQPVPLSQGAQVEWTSPPPMQSPKFGEATISGAFLPPPMSSPKLSRTILPSEGTQLSRPTAPGAWIEPQNLQVAQSR